MEQFYKEFLELCLGLWNLLNVPGKVVLILIIMSLAASFLVKLGEIVLEKKESEKSVAWGMWSIIFKVLSVCLISVLIICGLCYGIYPHYKFLSYVLLFILFVILVVFVLFFAPRIHFDKELEKNKKSIKETIVGWFNENSVQNFKGLQLLSFRLLIESDIFGRREIFYKETVKKSPKKTIIKEIMELVPIVISNKETPLKSKNFSIDVQTINKDLFYKIAKSVFEHGTIIELQIIAWNGKNLCMVFI